MKKRHSFRWAFTFLVLLVAATAQGQPQDQKDLPALVGVWKLNPDDANTVKVTGGRAQEAPLTFSILTAVLTTGSQGELQLSLTTSDSKLNGTFPVASIDNDRDRYYVFIHYTPKHGFQTRTEVVLSILFGKDPGNGIEPHIYAYRQTEVYYFRGGLGGNVQCMKSWDKAYYNQTSDPVQAIATTRR